ncbi:MerR family transcriptional regulator [Pseudonocardia nigra]|uniref:MerR family transcriptional regulator n=1 Tax=Pseudonocardia nigra TaxID=1921578 RepID=UPI001C5D1EB5|nr:MerR family transcriptional regulator [Pseudonocardia nigra]
MASTVDAQVPLTSSTDVGIGEAARRLGLAPSAIRFYESEGLLDAPARRDGRRRYGPDALRRLAFIAIARDLGLGLAAIRAALRPGPDGWGRVVDEQVAALDAQIARAQRAREVLLSSRDCPAPEPVRDCPYLRGALDALVAGAPLPSPHGVTAVPHRGARRGHRLRVARELPGRGAGVRTARGPAPAARR